MAKYIMDELERCRIWIEAALEYSGGTHEYIDVFHAILEGRMQLWPAENGCLVTELIVYPRKKVLHIFLAGGSMDQIINMHQDLIAWSKLQECTALSLAGRKGWTKVLKDFGWQEKFTTLIKEI